MIVIYKFSFSNNFTVQLCLIFLTNLGVGLQPTAAFPSRYFGVYSVIMTEPIVGAIEKKPSFSFSRVVMAGVKGFQMFTVSIYMSPHHLNAGILKVPCVKTTQWLVCC